MRKTLFGLMIACAAMAETALKLENPGFETEGKGWSGGDEFVRFTAEAARTGERGLHVDDTSAAGGASVHSRRFSVQPGRFYAIRFWGRSPAEERVTGVYMRFFNANGSLLPYSPAKKENLLSVGSSEWVLHTLIGKAPEGAAMMDVWIHSFSSGVGQTDLDDFSVSELTDDEAKTLKGSLRSWRLEKRIDEIAQMLPDKPRGCGSTGADRAKWASLMENPNASSYIAKAERQLTEEPVFLDDEVYLEFTRKGVRRTYEALLRQRSSRLENFVYAELAEWKGRFLPAIEADMERIFNEKSWTLPAHDGNLTCFRQEVFHGDLAATELAATLAQFDWWLGDRLSPNIRRRLREECLKRVINPYREDIRSDEMRNGQWWIQTKSNWNAVCTSNMVRACMILLEDKRERAEILAAMEISNRMFLKGFTSDGFCSEGVGYWNYGFGHFTTMAETVLDVTGGKLNIYDGAENIEAICAYARDIQIDDGICPAFADCSVKARPSSQVLTLIQRHFPQTLLCRMPTTTKLTTYVMNALLLFRDETPFAAKAPEKPAFPKRSLFGDAGIYIGRSFDDETERLGVAFKAGHNAELHNHNDVGSYVVVLNKHSYVVDPGNEIYTRRTFSAQRYESQMLNSFGHSVPVVAGQLQQKGRAASGRFVKTDFTDGMDTIVCDMTKAYAQVKELRSLLRTVRFDRAKKRLSVRDEVEFTSPQEFATAVITYQTIGQIDERNLAIYNAGGGVQVAISSEGGETAVEIGEVVNENAKNPNRIGITMTRPVLKGAITVEIDILPESFERIGFYQAPDEADFRPQTERAIMVEAESFSTQEGGEVIVTDKVDASGQAFKMWDNKGHRLSWSVDVPQDGVYAIQLRMANGNIDDEGLRNVAVDGALLHPAETPLRLPVTSGWANDKADDWRVVWLAQDGKAVLTPLAKGRHVLTMENADGHGIVLDWIRLIPVK